MNANLPSRCYAMHPSDNTLIVLQRGMPGFLTIAPTIRTSQDSVDKLNNDLGVTKAQAQAMLTGSMFGWNVPGADPEEWEGSQGDRGENLYHMVTHNRKYHNAEGRMTMTLYVIANRDDITLSQDLMSEVANEFRDNGTMLAADLSWMLVCSNYETASSAAQRLYTHAFPAAAGRYVDMGGGEVYVDDHGNQADDALAVLRSLADNGNEQAKAFFTEYSEDAWLEMADEALEVMSRVH